MQREAIQQILSLMQTNGVTIADLMQPVAARSKINQVHIIGGRWIEELSPAEWAARGVQAEHPSDAYEMEFDVPISAAPDGSIWAWIGPGVEVLPDRVRKD